MRLRQSLAREQGCDDFVSWVLETIGLERQWVDDLLDEMLRVTEAPYRAWLARVGVLLSLNDELRPWDLQFAAERGGSLPQEAFPREGLLPAVRRVADGVGLGEAAKGVQVDEADIPYAALCYAIRPPDDVRILFSQRDGRAHYDMLFHEFGHALHWRCLRPITPVFRWESPPFNEAMACLWERLVAESDWLAEREGVSRDQIAAHRKGWASRKIFRLRKLIAQTRFEFRAYQALDCLDEMENTDETDDGLLALFRSVHREILGVSYDMAPGWIENPFWTSHPVYLQNYVIGEAAASQTMATMRHKFDRLIGNPNVGAWLKEHYYALGAALPWEEKVKRATGVALGSGELLAELGC
jgi:Zn-dependent M32 family carboxypeptidase